MQTRVTPSVSAIRNLTQQRIFCCFNVVDMDVIASFELVVVS